MRLKDFKTAAKIISGTSIVQVFFDYAQVANTERVKLYPFVLWSFDSWKSRINWANINQIRERIKVRVFCFDSFDKSMGLDIEDAWDDIRTYFRGYCLKLNTNEQIQIVNMNDMVCEYFSVGLSVDSDIAVAFDLELDLFCNVPPAVHQNITTDNTHITIDNPMPWNL